MAETFLFEIVTPAQMMMSEQAELVVLPGGDGNFGVLPGHAPLLSTLRPGTIEIRDENLKVLDQIFVEEGFAEVTSERCTVLAEEAMRVNEITRDDAEERLKRAHDSLVGRRHLWRENWCRTGTSGCRGNVRRHRSI